MKKKDLVVLSILTFITVFVWTLVETYHSLVKSTLSPKEKRFIKPLSPNLEEEFILKIVEKRVLKKES